MCVLPAYMLLCIMGNMTPMTFGFPLRLADRHDEWAELFPSISLRDWSIQMLSSAPDFVAAANSKAGLVREVWLSGPEGVVSSTGSEKRTLLIGQDADFTQTREGRNLVMADDAAFREKSRALTAVERQKWLNSYMQKMLLVN